MKSSYGEIFTKHGFHFFFSALLQKTYLASEEAKQRYSYVLINRLNIYFKIIIIITFSFSEKHDNQSFLGNTTSYLLGLTFKFPRTSLFVKCVILAFLYQSFYQTNRVAFCNLVIGMNKIIIIIIITLTIFSIQHRHILLPVRFY